MNDQMHEAQASEQQSLPSSTQLDNNFRELREHFNILLNEQVAELSYPSDYISTIREAEKWLSNAPPYELTRLSIVIFEKISIFNVNKVWDNRHDIGKEVRNVFMYQDNEGNYRFMHHLAPVLVKLLILTPLLGDYMTLSVIVCQMHAFQALMNKINGQANPVTGDEDERRELQSTDSVQSADDTEGGEATDTTEASGGDTSDEEEDGGGTQDELQEGSENSETVSESSGDDTELEENGNDEEKA